MCEPVHQLKWLEYVRIQVCRAWCGVDLFAGTELDFELCILTEIKV